METSSLRCKKAQSFPLNGKMSIANATCAEHIHSCQQVSNTMETHRAFEFSLEASCLVKKNGWQESCRWKEGRGDITSLVAIVGEFLELWSDTCANLQVSYHPHKQIQKSHDLQVTVEPDSFSANADLYQICMSNWHQSIKQNLLKNLNKNQHISISTQNHPCFFHSDDIPQIRVNQPHLQYKNSP